MLYQFQDFNRATLASLVTWAHTTSHVLSRSSWLESMPGVAQVAAGWELLYRIGKEYPKPEFDIRSVEIGGEDVVVVEHVALSKPFCRLLRFKRLGESERAIASFKHSPKVLVVAPLSGHHATLLRDTVRALLTDHDVYITDWIDARLVPLSEGPFTLDDYVDYVRGFITHLGADRLHVVSVCQPCVPVLGAVSLMAAEGLPIPKSLTLMGGPIDPRKNPTKVNSLAMDKPFEWFERNLIQRVPARYPGHGRLVYPGFLQHMGFISTGNHTRLHGFAFSGWSAVNMVAKVPPMQ